jgi:hypothetical protein
LSNLSNKVIFFKHGTEKQEHIEAVDVLGNNLASMRQISVKGYQIDISKDADPENMAAILDFFEKRGSKFDEKLIRENSFLLANKFNDMWLQELNLV